MIGGVRETPEPLFEAHLRQRAFQDDVTANGKRFGVNTNVVGVSAPLTMG